MPYSDFGFSLVKVTNSTKNEQGNFGTLNDAFLEELRPFMKNIRVLNLTGQMYLTSNHITETVMSFCSNLESLCLNSTSITRNSLTSILQKPLKSLSIMGCALIQSNDVDEILDSNYKIKKLYSKSNSSKHSNLITSGDWFVDQQLDIFSLWAKACAKLS